MHRKILLIEDEASIRLGITRTLEHEGYEVFGCKDGLSGMKAFKNTIFDLTITDLRLPGMDGLEVLTKIKKIAPDAGVMIITAYPEVESAIAAIKKGAYDYIRKPFRNEELMMLLERFFQFRALKQENDHLKKTIHKKDACDSFICESTAMRKVMDLVGTVAPTDVPVLIQGESGTGKELVANALHRLSNRSEKPFLKINCAAIPENLLESELFGYERGAFTGAVQSQKGKFEVSHEGTIFFDEIGDMPLNLQPKLLRVLEDQSILKIGSATPLKVNVRMFFASGKNIKEMVSDGSFREDLFYRINVVPIQLPPLRNRDEDIASLIDYFLGKYTKKYGKTDLKIPAHIYEHLLNHHYPGNVRELKNIVERLVLLSTKNQIHDAGLSELAKDAKGNEISLSDPLTLEEGIKAYEKKRIIKALEKMKGKKMKAAEWLGISRKVLWKKMKSLGIGDEIFK